MQTQETVLHEDLYNPDESSAFDFKYRSSSVKIVGKKKKIKKLQRMCRKPETRARCCRTKTIKKDFGV